MAKSVGFSFLGDIYQKELATTGRIAEKGVIPLTDMYIFWVINAQLLIVNGY
ncbi:MAG: hypothetical protein IJN25_09625 [Clostridia bacterium]|nr:hypothetical protein [Clostridia bacterium]